MKDFYTILWNQRSTPFLNICHICDIYHNWNFPQIHESKWNSQKVTYKMVLSAPYYHSACTMKRGKGEVGSGHNEPQRRSLLPTRSSTLSPARAHATTLSRRGDRGDCDNTCAHVMFKFRLIRSQNTHGPGVTAKLLKQAFKRNEKGLEKIIK